MTAEPPPAPPAPPGEVRCPRCGAPVPADRDWCLECGYAARTAVQPTPRWRIPVALAAIVAVLALGALAFAFVDLTEDPEGAPRTTPATAPTTTPPTSTTPPPTVPTTPPTTTTPPPTTGTPPTTAPPATVPTTPTATAPAAP